MFKRYLILMISLLSLYGCHNETATLTSSTSNADSYGPLLTELSSNGGFTPFLEGEQKGSGKDGLVYITVDFKASIQDFNEEHIETTNAHLSEVKNIGHGKYQFILQPIIPTKVTVVIPESLVSHRIFDFKNNRSNELSFNFEDEEYEELKSNGLTVQLNSNKNKGVLEAEIEFNVSVKDFSESNLVIKNGAITKFTKESSKKWLVEITALEAGEVSAYVSEDEVQSKFFGYKNKRSNTVSEFFEDHEIDQTIKVETIAVGKKESYQPAKLVLVIDDSSSMADIQKKVAASLKNALASLKGKNVRVYAYSTTAIRAGKGNFGKTYGSQMPYGQGIFSNYTGSLPTALGLKTGGNYTNRYWNSNSSISPYLYKEVFVKKGSTTEPFIDGMFYNHDEVIEKYSINKSAFDSDDGSVFLSADLTDAEFNTALDKIHSTIDSFGVKGNTYETPLCTLLTILKNEGPHAILDTKEKTTFLVVTDETNATMPCLAGYHAENEVVEGVRIAALNLYRTISYSFEQKCDAGSDKICIKSASNRIRKPVADEEVEFACIYNGVNRCDTSAGVTQPCTSDQIAYVRNLFTDTESKWLPKDDSALACTFNIRQANPAFSTSYGSRGVTIRDTGVLSKIKSECDKITNFEYKDENDNWVKNTTQNLFEFLKENNTVYYQAAGIDLAYNGTNCSYGADNATTTLLGHDGGHSWYPSGIPDGRKDGFLYIDGLLTTEETKKAIHEEAKSLFGESNYTIVSIANLGEDNPAGCVNKVEAKSTDLIEISDTSISICNDSYDDAFTWFNQFLRFVPESTYDLKIQNFEEDVKTILGIKLSYQKNSLDKSEYDFVDGVLTFKDPNILKFVGGETFEIKYRNVVEESN